MTRRSLIALPIAALLLASCSVVRGNGKKTEEQRKVEPFSALEVSGQFRVLLQVSPQHTGEVALSLSGDENLLPLWRTSVLGGRLELRSNEQLWTELPLTLEAVTPPLNNVTLSGSSEGHIKGIAGDKFTLVSSGSAELTLEGSVKELRVEISGSGRVDARELKAETVVLKVSGSGDAQVFASRRLEVGISGSGKVEYSGGAPEVVQNISGSGEIVKR